MAEGEDVVVGGVDAAAEAIGVVEVFAVDVAVLELDLAIPLVVWLLVLDVPEALDVDGVSTKLLLAKLREFLMGLSEVWAVVAVSAVEGLTTTAVVVCVGGVDVMEVTLFVEQPAPRASPVTPDASHKDLAKAMVEA